MRIYLLPPSYNGESLLELTGKQYNYIVNVLRLKSGQKILGRDSLGQLWNLEVLSITKTSVSLSSEKTDHEEEQTDTLPQDRPEKTIILYQCIPKGRKTDDIIRMATEAGVKTIVLVRSKNCVADFSGKEESKLTRYDSVIKEAIQQSGSLVPTTVEGVIDISQVYEDLIKKAQSLNKKEIGIFLHQSNTGEKQESLYSILNGFDGVTGILIGSEGGLTNEECTMLLQAGMKPVLLKTNILRCETAAIYAIGAAQTILEQNSCV